MIYLVCLLVCCLLLYVYMIFPRFSKKKAFEKFERVHYAHRGLHDIYPENSLPAFEKAKNFGYGVELDVQLTKDEIVIVSHDFHLKRSCGIEKEIDNCLYEELRSLHIFNSEYTFCTFEEVLNIIDGKIPLIIEIKQKGINCSTCEKVAKILDTYSGDYVVESFNPIAMNWFLKHRNAVIRGQLSSDFSKDEKMHPVLKFALKHLLGNFLSRPDFIAYDIQHRKEFSFQLLKHFTKTVGWTCKSEKMEEDIQKDYSCIIFEDYLPNGK